MITLKTKIKSKDLEQESREIEDMAKQSKRSFLDIPREDKVRLRKAKWNCETRTIEEDLS